MLNPSEMKNKMLDLAKQDGYIDSIFSYCDRWCERCPFTSKCRNYALGKDAPSPGGPELWNYLHNVFQATMLMLEKSMEEMGIDPAELDQTKLTEGPDPKDHPLYVKAYAAVMDMDEWLDEHIPDEHFHGEEDIMPTGKKSHFSDSIEVINRYNFFIAAKIYRALTGINESEPGGIQTDSNGSAKIALIAIDRLIAAWSIVMENMMEHEDKILQFLISLAETRKQTEVTFPLARKFVRPGFDDFGIHQPPGR